MFNINNNLIFNKFFLDILKFYFALLFMFGLIIWIIQAVNFLDFITEDGHGWKIYLFYSILNFPKVLSRITPIIYFLTIFYIILKYENNNELKIFWLLGIEKINFLKKIIRFGIFFSMLLLIMNSLVVPSALNKARQFIINSNIDFLPSLIRENTFIDTVNKLTIYIEKKEKNIYRNIFIKDEKSEIIKIIYAKYGSLINDKNKKILILNDGKIVNINQNKISDFYFNKMNFDFSDYSTKSTIDFKVQERNSFELINCYYNFSIMNNKTFYDPINCNEPAIKEIQSELYKRFIKPFFITVISLVAGYLLFFSKEKKSFHKSMFLIFILGIVLIIISEIFGSFAKISHHKLIFGILFILITNISLFIFFKKFIDKIR